MAENRTEKTAAVLNAVRGVERTNSAFLEAVADGDGGKLKPHKRQPRESCQEWLYSSQKQLVNGCDDTGWYGFCEAAFEGVEGDPVAPHAVGRGHGR